MTSLKTSIKTITYLSDIGCLEIQGASLVSLFFAGRQDMLTKYALVAIIVLCITVLGFTLLVHSSLCELSIKERNIEFKAVLAYESKK
ncbi:protein hokG [Klebsiella pneumoniae]|nr:protein hokG [Klebsiella pneumoniae]STR77407.1 protein hokG [Klebsiella pneumoniae]STR80615.1 protein hokG [Klebsiella pneumoniae]STR91241.1 protein hokG [Klebsiella pneumoniae]STS11315.1 protein hokG [Klebsiella pneumoniae]